MNFDSDSKGPQRAATGAVATAAALGATAAVVSLSAHRTERTHPAAGRFIDVAGVRVHYLDEGSGPPIVLVHGNAMSSADFVASGVTRALAEQHRIIAFDRPGFGYTDRPRGTDWTPVRQAELLHAALEQLNVRDAIVVGHSLGSLVTVALALAHPGSYRALVLLSGLYYPAMPLGVPLFALPATPVIGDVMRFTTMPVFARLSEPFVVKQMFAPAPIAPSFANYPLSMSRRPSQLRATVEDANFADDSARELQDRYRELTLPVEILAGDGDAIVNTSQQSQRLALELGQSRFTAIQGAGHMIHHIAPGDVLAAIERAHERSMQG